MNTLILDNLAQIEGLCRKYRVERLDLFGSAATDDFDPAASDVDLLVEFEPMPPVEHADCFFGLLEELQQLFQRPVDLLEPEPIQNPYLWKGIEQSRRLLYEAA